MDGFIKKFKNGLTVKVNRKNVEKFLEIIQCNSKINWADGSLPMDFNPFLIDSQEKYFYIFYNKNLNGMQVSLFRENIKNEIYDFQNYKLDLEKPVVFRKSIAKFLTEKCQ